MKTILDGSRQLLLDVADILKGRNDAIFVGGWGPYLRNAEKHPGTLDVDLLFPAEHTVEQMKEIAGMFLEHQFSISAKHSFQLLKEYEIGSRSYVFNVDFLHPALEKTHLAEFRDIIDFDITIDGSRVKSLVSICMPFGDVLFAYGMSAVSLVEDRKIRLLQPAGVVFSKLQSCTNPKRPRDIFDIFLSCREQPELWRILGDLSNADHRVRDMITSYRRSIIDKWEFFTNCLIQYKVTATPEIQKLLIGEK